jgi:hypothetical protein
MNREKTLGELQSSREKYRVQGVQWVLGFLAFDLLNPWLLEPL